MANLDLTKYGITGTKEIYYNPSYEQLFKDEMDPSLTGYDVGQLTQTELDDALSLMGPQVERILAVKRGEEEPTRCGECDCCLHHRRLTGPMLAMDW